MADDALATESTELLRTLIRNACVNDGRVTSGQEVRNADALEDYFAGSGLVCERYVAAPGRESLIVRIEGDDASAPVLLLMGHTDVVPANPTGWQRDPFGAEVEDGIVWGRGAIDMLNLTATMAVAVWRLRASDFRPRGTLIYLAVADEEALGTYGAGHLIEHEPGAVRADYVITESGGVPIPTSSGPLLPLTVGEKGVNWRRLVVRGVPTYVLSRRALPTTERRALAFYASTGLPLIVAITTLGIAAGQMRSDTSAGLVGAGMVSVLVYPVVAGIVRTAKL